MGATAAGDESDRQQARADNAHASAEDDVEPTSPDLLEALRQIGATGRAGLGAAADTAKALRTLVAADISLARSAVARSAVLGGLAAVFGGSAWLLLMATLVVFLSRQFALPWSAALLIPALLSVVAALVAGWFAMGYFEHTRLQATRRQLARLGIGELADFMPDPDSPGSARDAAGRNPPQDVHGEPVKDHRGIDVTPP